MHKDVVVTGIGVISPVGIGKDAFWDSLVNGRSSYSEIDRFDASAYPTRIAAQVSGFDPEKYVHAKTLRRIRDLNPNGGLQLMYAVGAAKLAVEDSGLDMESEDKTRVGSMIGSASGDVSLFRGGPHFQRTQFASTSSANACIVFEYGLRGPCYALSGACATGGINLAYGYEKIMRSKADVMLVGSASALIVPELYADYSARGSPMTSRNEPMRPFDKNRSGFILGEGAAVLVIEDEEKALRRGAHIYARVDGYGEATDVSTHFADVTAQGYLDSMSIALHGVKSFVEYAMLDPKEIYFSAHGTATRKNDEVEMKAFEKMFGTYAADVLVSAIKGTTGHCQEASSSMELAASAMVLDKQIVPPTIGMQELDPAFEKIRIVKDAPYQGKVAVTVTNSSGFCGVYSTVVMNAV